MSAQLGGTTLEVRLMTTLHALMSSHNQILYEILVSCVCVCVCVCVLIPIGLVDFFYYTSF